jgi:hypothetical protein
MTPEIKREMQYLPENGNIQTSESIEIDNRSCVINPWGSL